MSAKTRDSVFDDHFVPRSDLKSGGCHSAPAAKKSSAFIRGLTRIIDFTGTIDFNSARLNRRTCSVTESINNDWISIGNDMKTAINAVNSSFSRRETN